MNLRIIILIACILVASCANHRIEILNFSDRDVLVEDAGSSELVALKSGESVTIESSDEGIYIKQSIFYGNTYVDDRNESFSFLPALKGDGKTYVFHENHLYTPQGNPMNIRSVKSISPRSIPSTDFTGK